MTPARPDLVVIGQVVLSAGENGVTTAEAIGIGNGRVLVAGSREEVLAAAVRGARVLNEPSSAVVPGLHDFHLHLVGMARLRREVRLDGLAGADILARVHGARERVERGAWLRGRGWAEAEMDSGLRERLNQLLRDMPAVLYSHDAHSAWASPAAMERAGIVAATPDPAGGRIEREADGSPTGVLRERATDAVETVAGRLGAGELDAALDEVVAELAAWGITAVTDAGDTTADNGVAEYAELGDRASQLLAAASRLDGRLRLTVGFPGAAIAAAARLGLATGRSVGRARTVRGGWAKVYADGALGSRTAAIFEPYTCGDAPDTGILRVGASELDGLTDEARRAGIGLAVHVIGDRAAAAVLDAMERAPAPRTGTPPDRLEHLQLLRPADRSRLAALGLTASMQPIHCAADRGLVEACWSDRAALAYPWRSLHAAGVRLAFGSDAPIESANPWHGIFAAVHRRLPHDGSADWQPAEALPAGAALAGYTVGPAAASGVADEGHLRPGARADLAVLSVDLPTLLAADERLAGVRSLLTLVDGREIHLSAG